MKDNTEIQPDEQYAEEYQIPIFVNYSSDKRTCDQRRLMVMRDIRLKISVLFKHLQDISYAELESSNLSDFLYTIGEIGHGLATSLEDFEGEYAYRVNREAQEIKVE